MDVRLGSLFFPALRGNGPRTASQAVIFPRQVERAVAGLTGYSVGFSGADHHLGLLDLELSTSVNSNVAQVTGTFGLRDWSGNWDDDYQGTVQFAVLAELQAVTAPPPRGDLAITGMEFTQCIQSFRSAQFLDGPNVRPDNSIQLIARKTTMIRVYVDYDRSSGLPIINSLSGELQLVTSSGASLTLAP